MAEEPNKQPGCCGQHDHSAGQPCGCAGGCGSRPSQAAREKDMDKTVKALRQALRKGGVC